VVIFYKPYGVDEEMQALRRRIAALIRDVAGPQADMEAHAILDVVRNHGTDDISGHALELAYLRSQKAPLGLVTGQQSFLGVRIQTGSEVFVPREETELLGSEVIRILQKINSEIRPHKIRLIDMGCGSGNITCAVALAVTNAQVWASDISQACADLTRKNVNQHGLQKRVNVTQGDLFEPLQGLGLEESMDLIVMNPPYIATSSLETMRSDLLLHEPLAAFDGGPYGISVKSRLIREGYAFLKPNAYLIFEFGVGQTKQVRLLVSRTKLYREMEFVHDKSGEPRVAIIRK
jgi:release factor glutamine methyltransferase